VEARGHTVDPPLVWLETRRFAPPSAPSSSRSVRSLALAGPDRPNLTQSPELSRRHFGADAPDRAVRLESFEKRRFKGQEHKMTCVRENY
jgi:hypothetical protein